MRYLIMNFGFIRTYTQMMKFKQLNSVLRGLTLRTGKVLCLSAVGVCISSGTAQAKVEDEKKQVSPAQTSSGYTQKAKHTGTTDNNLSFADGIKIKRDLSILEKIQEQHEIDENAIPADDLYGQIWNTRYVNSYQSLTSVPDTFRVDLAGFVMPTTGRVTSFFGPRGRRHHYGIDLKVQVGDTIYAAFDGKVRVKQFERRGYGYYIALRHPNGLETVYAHLSKFLVEQDENVKAGQPIALGGNTGRSTGAHLHFETRFLGRPIDPTRIIDFENQVCHQDEYLVDATSYISLRTSARLNSKLRTTATNNKFTKGSVDYHRVRKGDTLGKIAKQHGTTVKKLCQLNKITAKTTLRIGQTLRVS